MKCDADKIEMRLRNQRQTIKKSLQNTNRGAFPCVGRRPKRGKQPRREECGRSKRSLPRQSLYELHTRRAAATEPTEERGRLRGCCTSVWGEVERLSLTVKQGTEARSLRRSVSVPISNKKQCRETRRSRKPKVQRLQPARPKADPHCSRDISAQETQFTHQKCHPIDDL